MSDKEKLKDLLVQYAEISKEIANHPWMRNNNSPLGDLAERIVADGLGGTVADNNAKGYDVELPDGQLIQVKGVTYRGKNNLFTSAIRSMSFDSVAIVVCNPDFSVREGLLVPRCKVVQVSRHHKALNGYQISVSKARAMASDITSSLAEVW
jgi:hypothetical protein